MADREIKIQCPSCGECELTISDIERPDKWFVRETGIIVSAISHEK
jgi:hypothetical protein